MHHHGYDVPSTACRAVHLQGAASTASPGAQQGMPRAVCDRHSGEAETVLCWRTGGRYFFRLLAHSHCLTAVWAAAWVSQQTADQVLLVSASHALLMLHSLCRLGQDLLSRVLPDALPSITIPWNSASAVNLPPGWLMLACMRRLQQRSLRRASAAGVAAAGLFWLRRRFRRRSSPSRTPLLLQRAWSLWWATRLSA